MQFTDCFAFDSAAAIPVLAILLTRKKKLKAMKENSLKKTQTITELVKFSLEVCVLITVLVNFRVKFSLAHKDVSKSYGEGESSLPRIPEP